MALLGNEGELISRNDARQMMSDYENSPAFAANDRTKGFLFGRDHLDSILVQPGCKGVRIYYGKKGVLSSDPSQLIIVGTDVDGNDMSEGVILDTGIPCPDFCSTEATKL